ncbi:MAG: tripartite tricarboxylate transporter substrate binding protein [Bacillota bacterium]
MRRTRTWMALTLALLLLVAAGCGGASKPAAEPAKEPAKTEPKPEAPKEKSWAPEKQVTLVVPYSAGGSTDLLARAVEKVWPKYVKQPLVVVNKSAAGGIEGRQFVVNAQPDGYTLLAGYGSGEDLVTPQVRKLPFDTFTDLVSVARLSIHSIIVAVPANSPHNSLKDLVDWAKKEKKPITASVSTAAGSVDLVMRGIGTSAGVEVTTVPHSGGSQAVTTLVGGQTMMGGGHPSEIMPHVKSGKLKAIGVALPERDPATPDIPTLREQGIPFHTWGSVKGIAAPKGTPPEVIKFYEGVFKQIAEDPDFKKAMADMLQPIMYQNSKDFGAFMKQAYDDYAKLIKELNIPKQ